jgi:hypothetical protein
VPELLFRAFSFNDLTQQFLVRARKFRGSFFDFGFEFTPRFSKLEFTVAQSSLGALAGGAP